MVSNHRAELEAVQNVGTNPEDLVLVPESIVSEARLIRSLCDHYRASLNETLSATPEVNVQSVQDAINFFKLNYEELTVVLDRLLDTQTKLLPAEYSNNIKEANKLFEAIKEAKSKIVTGLIMEAELKYDARIKEESVAVPIGEVVNDEPDVINFAKPDNGNEKELTVEEINKKAAEDFNTIEQQLATLEYSEAFLKAGVPVRVQFEKTKSLLEEGKVLKNTTAKSSSLTGPARLSELKRRVDYFADFVAKIMLEFNELNKLMKSLDMPPAAPSAPDSRRAVPDHLDPGIFPVVNDEAIIGKDGIPTLPMADVAEVPPWPPASGEGNSLQAAIDDIGVAAGAEEDFYKNDLRDAIEEYANPPMATEPTVASETLDNKDATSGQESQKSEEKNIEKDIKWGLRFYGHWQNGNLDGVFKHKNQKWVEKETIVKIRQDIKITLEAAGYSEPEINNFFETKVNPWAEEVVDQRKTRKFQDIDHGALKGQIINAVREMIKDREPNPEVFRAYYESQGVGNTNQPAEVVGDLADSAVGDNLAESAEYTPIPADFTEDDLGSPVSSEITDSEVLSGATVNFENLNTADELPVADSAAVAATEATPAEISPELAEAKEVFTAEKSRHEELLEIVDINSGEQKDLPYLIDADLWRAGMVFKSVDSILSNPRYNDEERAEKLRGPVTVLKEINKKIADILTQKSLLASPEAAVTPEPVEEAGSKDMPALEWSPATPEAPTPEPEPLPSAEGSVPVPTPEAIPVPPVPKTPSPEAPKPENPNPETSPALLAYREKRLAWRERNRDFKAVENKYKTEIANYYKNRGFLEKIRTGSRSLLGLKPTLPYELAVLQGQYQNARATYAKDFRDVTALRGAAHPGNADINLSRPEVKVAFANKFVIRPAQRMLDLQMNTALEEKRRSKVQKVLKFVGNHKVALRVGSIAFAGVLGALSGGASLAATAGGFAAGAGTGALRMKFGAMAGLGAGALTNQLMQGRVNRAEKAVAEVEAAIKADFDIDDFSEDEEKLTAGMAKRSSTKAQQVFGTGVAGVAGGFAGGFTSGALATESLTAFNDDVMNGGSDPINDRLDEARANAQATVSNPEPVYNDNVMRSGSDPVNDNIVDEAAERASGPETLPTLVQVGKVEMPDTRLGAMTVTNIELQGSGSVGTLEAGTIPDSEVGRLYKAIDVATKDILEPNPHTPKAEVERLLFDKIQKQYGDASWWKQADISQIKIEDISIEYTVKPGDTIWEIAQENSEALKDVPAEDRPRVLMELRERIDASPELREEIGVSSDKADLIRTGEKLDLAEMEEEIRDIIADEKVLPARPGTGALPINADGVEAGVQDVKIKFEPVPFKPDQFGVVNVEGATTAMATPEFDAAVAGPRPFSLDGNYFDTEVYKDYVLGHFGGEEQLAKFLDRAITKVEGPQTAWDEIVGKPRVYDVIKDMTVKDLTDMQKAPGEIKAFAALNDIDENKLQEWMFNFGEMKKGNLPYADPTKFSDLFSRATVEPYISSINKGNLG